MNPAGHGRIAADVGIPLLLAAFQRRGHRQVPLNAFALGNWLTDVQQVVDPVTSSEVVREQCVAELKRVVAAQFDDLLAALYLRDADDGSSPVPKLLRPLRDRVAQPVTALRDAATDAIDALVAASADDDADADADAGGGLLDHAPGALRAIGYFKFVHGDERLPRLAHEAPEGPRMDLAAYFEVFDRLFTQYYPHEHFDRPPRLDALPLRYHDEVATGPRSRPRSDGPDLYEHVREDIEITAGKLAAIERAFGQVMFDLDRAPRPDDPAWHLSLATLGRAMHAVEDFFAHSTFVEHALAELGPDAQPTSARSATIVDLRLRRLEQPRPGALPSPHRAGVGDGPDRHIATGFFDCLDTLFSVLHVAEELFGARLAEPDLDLEQAIADTVDTWRRPDVALLEVQDLVYEVSEILDDPARALRDQANVTAQQLRSSLPVPGAPITPEVVRALLASSPLFNDAPGPIQDDLTRVLVALHQVVEGTGAGITVYRALRTFTRVISHPIEAMKQALGDWLGSKIRDVVVFHTLDLAESRFGARRIGSHSLLNKDDAVATMHAHGWNCAAAVHHHVLAAFTRVDPSLADRARPDVRFVDWLELLEFYLDHPGNAPTRRPTITTRCVSVPHVVERDSLATLAERYRATACRGAPGPASARAAEGTGAFTWRTIADANFGTEGLAEPLAKRVVNETLRRTGTGYPVRDGVNYAFRPGTTVLIPRQERSIEVAATPPRDGPWWAAIFTRIGPPGPGAADDASYHAWRVVTGYEDRATRTSHGAARRAHVPQLLDEPAAARRAAAASEVLARRIAAYAPPPSR